jgi:hypothetical protein
VDSVTCMPCASAAPSATRAASTLTNPRQTIAGGRRRTPRREKQTACRRPEDANAAAIRLRRKPPSRGCARQIVASFVQGDIPGGPSAAGPWASTGRGPDVQEFSAGSPAVSAKKSATRLPNPAARGGCQFTTRCCVRSGTGCGSPRIFPAKRPVEQQA